MPTTFEVIAEPNRRQILDLLREQSLAVGDLVAELGLAQPAVSKHLRILRNAGLVSVQVDAQRRLYRLRPEPLRELDAWLTPYRRYWSKHLDALERHLDAMPDQHTSTKSRTATLTENREAAALGGVGSPPRPQAEGRGRTGGTPPRQPSPATPRRRADFTSLSNRSKKR